MKYRFASQSWRCTEVNSSHSVSQARAEARPQTRDAGHFAPRSDERDRWEKIAAAQEADREAERSSKHRKRGESGTGPGYLTLQTTRANHRK